MHQPLVLWLLACWCALAATIVVLNKLVGQSFRQSMCPVMQAIMQHPVIAADGHTYERAAMEQWLRQHNTSPVTGCQLARTHLISNVLIKCAISTHQDMQ